MTTEEGEKYTRRADETRLLIDELMQKKEKEPTEEDFASADNISIAVEFPLSTAYAISSCSLDFKTSMFCKSSSVGSFSFFCKEKRKVQKILKPLLAKTGEKKAQVYLICFQMNLERFH
jgi:citrate synthase